jgi:CO/xanthine dehydrogenase FAD-binding subunit
MSRPLRLCLCNDRKKPTMLLNVTEYYRPETIAEAIRLLARPGVKTAPLAGGTLLTGQRDDMLQAVVDLRALGLNTITEQDGQIHLGAMVTLQALVDAPLLGEVAGGILAQAATSSAARLIRNAATVGGTLAAGPAANADMAVALTVLEAQARLVGEHERLVPAEVVFEQRQPGELLTEVVFKRPAASTESAFLRLARTPTDVALIHTAALVHAHGGTSQRVRVAVGGVGMSPTRLYETEAALEGLPPLPEKIDPAVKLGLASFAPPPDFRASPEYRREMAAVLARRALEQCFEAARWKQLMG